MNDLENIREILEENIIEEFDENTDLLEEGLIDSFDLIQIVKSLEESFHVFIDMGSISRQDFRNAESIYALLCKIMEERGEEENEICL